MITPIVAPTSPSAAPWWDSTIVGVIIGGLIALTATVTVEIVRERKARSRETSGILVRLFETCTDLVTSNPTPGEEGWVADGPPLGTEDRWYYLIQKIQGDLARIELLRPRLAPLAFVLQTCAVLGSKSTDTAYLHSLMVMQRRIIDAHRHPWRYRTWRNYRRAKYLMTDYEKTHEQGARAGSSDPDFLRNLLKFLD